MNNMPKFKVNDSTNNPVRIGDTVDLIKINVKTPNDPYVRRSELKSELNILRVELNHKIDVKFNELNNRMNKLENKMDTKFEELNTKFEELNTKLELLINKK